MKEPFIQIQQRLYDCNSLDIYHINIISWIASYQRQDQPFFMSKIELARKFVCDKKTIYRRFADLEKHGIVYKDGKYQGIGLDNWTPDARSHYSVGMQRFIDNVVQRNDVGSMNRWFTTDYTRVLTQFRTFTLGSYTKQLMKRLYVLAETRGKDYHTYGTFMASMVGAAQFYAVQSYINSFGRSDRKEYLEDAERRVKILTDDSFEFKVPFKDIFETYKQDGQEVRTGNKLLPKPCTMCGFKAHCWKDAVLHDRITSKAKQPPQAWYSRLKKKAL